jgi:Ca-activated chloride channel family protein
MLSAEWFLQPGFLLLVLPVAALLAFALVRKEDRRTAVPVPGFEWLPRNQGCSRLQSATTAVLRALALLALIPLVAGLAEREEKRKESHTGAVVIVLDNSSSMTARDFGPFNRLDAAKRSLAAFLTRLPETGIGLVALAGSPQIVAPVTHDRRFILDALQGIGPAAYEDDGTAIGSGIASAVNRLRKGGVEPNRILLITDGVGNRGAVSAADAAEVARLMGVRVDAMGIGTDKISRFAVPTADGPLQEVEARIEIDDKALGGLVTRTGGSYTRVRDLAGLERGLLELAEAYAPARTSGSRDGKRDWMPTLASLAIGLFGVELLLCHFVFREIPQ